MSPTTKAADAALEKLLIEMRSDKLEVESINIQPEPVTSDPIFAHEPSRIKIVIYVTRPDSSKR